MLNKCWLVFTIIDGHGVALIEGEVGVGIPEPTPSLGTL